ncbi:hypothetical protein ElyMa_005948900 [Elysia marginata]|uniref:Uncharacterized protein n=1 Tax=Elysia marginata TaxID=1093978 RepID=A0AAV4GD75_9GAST|nr:hypothetical protein ElyMa_005948900 [Elysia marginata]
MRPSTSAAVGSTTVMIKYNVAELMFLETSSATQATEILLKQDLLTLYTLSRVTSTTFQGLWQVLNYTSMLPAISETIRERLPYYTTTYPRTVMESACPAWEIRPPPCTPETQVHTFSMAGASSQEKQYLHGQPALGKNPETVNEPLCVALP